MQSKKVKTLEMDFGSKAEKIDTSETEEIFPYNSFQIQVGGEPVYLMAQTREEFDLWIKKLNDASHLAFWASTFVSYLFLILQLFKNHQKKEKEEWMWTDKKAVGPGLLSFPSPPPFFFFFFSFHQQVTQTARPKKKWTTQVSRPQNQHPQGGCSSHCPQPKREPSLNMIWEAICWEKNFLCKQSRRSQEGRLQTLLFFLQVLQLPP